MVVVGDIKPLCFVYVSLFRSLKKVRKQPHIRKSGKIKVMGASIVRFPAQNNLTNKQVLGSNFHFSLNLKLLPSNDIYSILHSKSRPIIKRTNQKVTLPSYVLS